MPIKHRTRSLPTFFGQQGALAWEQTHTLPTAAEVGADAAGTAAAAVEAHEAAANPHPTYLTQAEGDALYEPVGAVDAHEAANDPHSAASVLSAGGKVALINDAVTGERGIAVKMINRTGAASVKGMLVAPSTTTDKEVIPQEGEFDTIGIVYESGVAEGSEMWVWVGGSLCQVLVKNGVAVTRADLMIAADTDGRADSVGAPPPPPTDAIHFREIGHAMESKASGTDVLCLCMIHFN